MKHPILVKDPRSTVFSRALRTGPVSFFLPLRLKRYVEIVANEPVTKQMSKEYTTGVVSFCARYRKNIGVIF